MSKTIEDHDGVTRVYDTCEHCTDIIVQGYTDTIDDTEQHKQMVISIDAMLMNKAYWLSDSVEIIKPSVLCDCCGSVRGTTHMTFSRIDTKE